MRFISWFHLLAVSSSLLLLPGCSGLRGDASLSQGKAPSTADIGYPDNYLEFKAGKDPENMIAADFNNDGVPDVAIVSHGDNCIKIFRGKGDRKFELHQTLTKEIVGFHPDFIASTDWDGDGFLDLILAAEGTHCAVYLKNVNGERFVSSAKFQVKYPPKSIAVSDIDNDGNKDVVLGPYSYGNVMVLWGKGKPGFDFDASEIKAGPFASSVCIADWNNDGKPDVFWTETERYNIKVAVNLGNRKFLTKTLFHRSKIMLELPRSVVTADIDGDGCIDALSPLEIGRAAVIIYGDCRGGLHSIEKIKAPSWGYRGIGAIAAGETHPAMIALGEKKKMFIGIKDGAGEWKLREYKAGNVPENFMFTDIDQDGHIDVLFVDSAGDTGSIYFGPLI